MIKLYITSRHSIFSKYFFQLISDAGFQGEITSISTAAQQIEVFSRVLKTAIAGFLQNTEDWQSSIQECAVSIVIKNVNY